MDSPLRVLPFKTTYFFDKYVLLEELGHGNFGAVYSCLSIAGGEQFACKIIEKDETWNEEVAEEVRQEIAALETVRGCEGIVGMHEVFEDIAYIYIVMEFCNGGELFDLLLEVGRFDEYTARKIFRDIASAVHTCHSRGLLHRDLKPENILIKDEIAADKSISMNENFSLKLADFGLSLFLSDGDLASGSVGSSHYLAPEVVKGELYDFKADIWSLGVILYALLSGRLPFIGKFVDGKEDDEEKLFDNIRGTSADLFEDPWPTVSENAKDLVRNLLQRNAQSRLSAKDILSHPWLSRPSQNSICESQILSKDFVVLQQCAQDQISTDTSRVSEIENEVTLEVSRRSRYIADMFSDDDSISPCSTLSLPHSPDSSPERNFIKGSKCIWTGKIMKLSHHGKLPSLSSHQQGRGVNTLGAALRIISDVGTVISHHFNVQKL
eukprot:TRINITY_DN3734_c0_g1_i1.p1 TRINITY_DN3734_c0_g1~~TRINITY_DN3734_c0_g1_i1.p1  ORF type:complete len:438 (+),score=42.60 TRINITY_DN3734_c0_g1_i1:68-1381(+)